MAFILNESTEDFNTLANSSIAPPGNTTRWYGIEMFAATDIHQVNLFPKMAVERLFLVRKVHDQDQRTVVNLWPGGQIYEDNLGFSTDAQVRLLKVYPR